MRSSFVAAAALVGLVNASPMPQGVTSHISPSGSRPPMCSTNHPTTFGIAIVPLSTASSASSASSHSIAARQVYGATTSSSAPYVYQTSSSSSSIPVYKSSSKSSSPVVYSTSTTPVIYSTSTPYSYGQSSTTPSSYEQSSSTPVTYVTPSSHKHSSSIPVTYKTPSSYKQSSYTPITYSTAGKTTTTSIPVYSSPHVTPPAYTPHPTMVPVSQIPDGQVQGPVSASTLTLTIKTTVTLPYPASTISDGQVQAPTSYMTTVMTSYSTIVSTPYQTLAESTATSTSMYGAHATPHILEHPAPQMTACASNNSLELTLARGILKDSKKRTGYIASNHQFQFDNPPQAGALYTAGFSACKNGTLALGNTTVFWQCQSGNFFNLYDEPIGAQCSAVELNILTLENCTTPAPAVRAVEQSEKRELGGWFF